MDHESAIKKIPWLSAGVPNSNVTMKFVQLQYFYAKILMGTKDIVPPCPKVGGHVRPARPGGSRSVAHVEVDFATLSEKCLITVFTQ